MRTIAVSRGVIVGLFIFLGISIFVAGIFTIGSQQKTFEKTVSLKVIFDDVSGLQKGNNIWLSGVKIGTVKKINFTGNAEVEVTMGVDKEARLHIRKDSRAKISSDGFIGNRIIIIYGGSPSLANVYDGDILQSEKSVSTDEMFATLQGNNKNLLDITTNLKEISKRIKEGNGSVGKLINDPDLANNLESSLLHIKASSISAQQAISRINDYVSGLHKEGSLANEIIYDTTAFANLKETLSTLKEASNSISSFASNLKQVSGSLNRTDNTAGAILHDPKIASDLKEISSNLNESSRKLSLDLTALQHNFLLRGFFKKQKKQQNKTDTLSHK